MHPERHAYAVPAMLALFLCAAGLSSPSAADEVAVRRETQLKSAYLLNFVKFVEWPVVAADEPLTVCFLGASSMREALEVGIESKRVGTRPLALRQLQDSSKMDGC